MQGMWEYCSFERTKAKKFLKDAEKEKQEGIQCQWQQESPAKEYLEQVKRSAHTDCTPRTVKFGYFALKRRRLGGRRNYVEEHRILAAYHRARRRTRRCYDVVSVAKL